MENIDFNLKNAIPPEKGYILLSEPFLNEEFFRRSVILICEHNENGSFGFVLNNYLDINLKEILDDFPSLPIRLSLGGPVKKDNLFFIHTLGDLIPNSFHIVDGIYLGGSHDVLTKKIQETPNLAHQVRFFLGYSGWDVNQLQEELDANSWFIVKDIDAKKIMDTSDNSIWKNIMEKQGAKHKIIAQFPIDPNLN